MFFVLTEKFSTESNGSSVLLPNPLWKRKGYCKSKRSKRSIYPDNLVFRPIYHNFLYTHMTPVSLSCHPGESGYDNSDLSAFRSF